MASANSAETGSTPKGMLTFKKTGGIRIGDSFWLAWNYTIPFAELSLSVEGLSIRYMSNEVNINKKDVLQIKKKHGIFTPGIQIIHSAKDMRPFILFWTYDVKNVLTAFRELGYPVAD
jgi:hypothetical protein